MKSQKTLSVFMVFNLLLAFLFIGVVLFHNSHSVAETPLTMYYSEAGRIFEAGQVYSRIVFGRIFPWPWLDPGRAILDGLVFLIPGNTIWTFRFWVFLASCLMTTLASLLAIRRAARHLPKDAFHGRRELVLITLAVWGALFLFQGPIYSHILLGAVLVLCSYNEKKPLLTSAGIILASAWEGLCRVNWFLVPAVLAVVLYLLSTPVENRRLFEYLKRPFLWGVLGMLSSVVTYLVYIRMTRNIIPFLDPDMNYLFFRGKLWPNNGSALGLIPGIALVSIPILVIIAWRYFRLRRTIHWIRPVLIILILGLFFIGSTYVSIRAGGGYNLHNYDSFLLLLFTTGVHFGLDHVSRERMGGSARFPLFESPLSLTILLCVSGCFAILGVPLRRVAYPGQEPVVAILRLDQFLKSECISDKPILFIENRQFLVYQYIIGIEPFIPYEKTELTEMAMARNSTYLEIFARDIQALSFACIVSDFMRQDEKGSVDPYWYEHNVWISGVSFPIHDYYELIFYEAEYGLAVYGPK